jgi:hypothetical protein
MCVNYLLTLKIKERWNMRHAAIEQGILTYLHKLAPIQQEQVLNFVQKLAEAPLTGVPGAMLCHLLEASR